ncbi:MAG TPA: ferritin-like domain-containing protein [Enhygromyxa sp.]|nr:ferritin-like domain-containing protein [Enhygromyxa sp.]
MLTLRDEERAVVAAMWAFRARSEDQAAARFARIADRLDALAAPEPLRALARRAIDDERRHRARCAALAERFGHASLDSELVEAPAPEVAPSQLPPARRVTYELVAFCCLTESINAALLTRSFAETSEPDSKAAVREILADEVQHARLGWAYLAHESDRAWLAEHFARMLAATVPEELRDPRIQPDPSPALRAHGVFARAELREILIECVDGVITPGLALLGVDAEPIRAWMTAHVHP